MGSRPQGRRLHFADRGAIAQLGERLDRTQEVAGSSPASSTQEAPANPKIWIRATIAGSGLIYLRATKLRAENLRSSPSLPSSPKCRSLFRGVSF